MASSSVKKLYEWQKAKVNSGYNYHGTPAYAPSISELEKLEAIANRFGFPFEWLANLINFESAGTFNTAVQNASTRATGLIQFMPSTASNMGTSVDALKNMSFEEQLKWVYQYLFNFLEKRLNSEGKVWDSFNQTDLFMIIFYPISVGNPNYQFPSKVVNANGGIKTPIDYTKKALKSPPFPDIPFSLADIKKKVNNNTTEGKDKDFFGKWYFLVGICVLFGSLITISVIKARNN